MKKVLFSLMLLAIYASANTCTEAWFEIQNPTNVFIPKNAPHPDSVYFRENNEDHFLKAIYSDGHIDQTLQGLILEDIGSGITDFTQYYISKDEGILSNKNSEVLISDSTFGDTTYYSRKCYYNGKQTQLIYHKVTNNYISSFSIDSIYLVKLSSYYSWEEFSEFFFRNDTLVQRDTSNYSSPDGSPINQFIYFVEDPNDDFKCYGYRNDSLTHTLIYHTKENGYSIELSTENEFSEYFMVNPNGTSAIHKRRAPVKISPKARYFDLLGRYKFTK